MSTSNEIDSYFVYWGSVDVTYPNGAVLPECLYECDECGTLVFDREKHYYKVHKTV